MSGKVDCDLVELFRRLRCSGHESSMQCGVEVVADERYTVPERWRAEWRGGAQAC